MIQIIKTLGIINRADYTLLGDPDSFIFLYEEHFEANVLDKLSLDVVEKIDESIPKTESSLFRNKIYDSDLRVTELSTGCKTILMYLHYMRNKEQFSRGKKVIIDASECGWNALEMLFECAEKLNDSETIFLVTHTNYLYKLSKRDYLINFKTSINDPMLI